MKEEVVYIIGAGFSATAGLPVMSNFLEKAKDIYLKNPEEYDHFQKVINYINDLSSIKNYYSSNLHNIEEILSIIEMGESVGGRDEVGFRAFIRDTIEFYTPERSFVDDLQINHQNFLGDQSIYKIIGAFALSLTNTTYKPSGVDTNRIGVGRKTRYDINFMPNKDVKNTYSIITLNYDRLIESIFEYISEHTSLVHNEGLFFRDADGLSLYKLHGSIETEIIPPTWNKILSKHVQKAWEGAYKVLKNAKHIRILGYSLPESDAYIKYLFKAAVAENNYLKSIDIICLDDDNRSVEKRYRDFINYHKLRFKSADLNYYLTKFWEPLQRPHISDLIKNNRSKQLAICEKVHQDMMNI